MRKLSFISALLLVTACGSDDKGSPAPQPEVSKVYATAAVLPACDASREGLLAYVKDLKQFQYCESSAWQVAEDGSSISSTVDCSSTLTQDETAAKGLTVPASGVDLRYRAVTLRNGTVIVDASTGIGAEQASGSITHHPSTIGGRDAYSSFLRLDVNGVLEGGFWLFTKNPVKVGVEYTYRVTYYDSVITPQEFTFAGSQCKFESY